MKIPTHLALLGVVLAAVPLAAAEPDTSFLKLYAQTRGFMLGRPTKPKVTPDGKTVLFLRSEPKSPKLKLYDFDIATKTVKELLSPESLLKGVEENLSPEEKARRERQRVTAGGFADYHLDPDGKHVMVSLSGKLYIFDRTTGKTRELKTGDGSPIDQKWSPDGKTIAYVRGYDVYAYDLATDKETPVTTGGTAIKTHGLAEFVAQEEMNRSSGFWWSPDSMFIAYEEADHTGVETWWIADPLKPDAKPQEQFYPRPGKKNVSVRLGIVPVGGGETKWIVWNGETPEYLAAVKWEGLFTALVQDRKQKKLLLMKIDPETGHSRVLDGIDITEMIGVAPNHQLATGWLDIPNGAPLFVPALGGYFWLDGELRDNSLIQLRDADSGKLLRIVLEKGDPNEILAAFASPSGTDLIYSGYPDPTQLQVYQLTVVGRDHKSDKKAKDEPLGRGDGVHTASFATNGAGSAITSTSLQKMPKTWVHDRGFREVGALPSVALEPSFVPNVRVLEVGKGFLTEPPFPHLGTFRRSSSDYLYTAIVRPRDFDPKKKYPVLVDVYGGPTHLQVVQAMRNWLIPQWIADQGFIVVAIDNRGTPGRGREWEKAIYKKFGTVPLEDQVKGLHALCDKFPEMDRDRVGIFGWSFGGYMAANAVLRKPDVFKAAVAGAPVTDWEDYDTHYTERYIGLLPENKKAYEEASLIPLAKNLNRPLLLVHGTADDNVYFRHTLKLTDALFRAGREFEVLPLPGVTHMSSADPVVMEKLWLRTLGFFKRHLGEPKSH